MTTEVVPNAADLLQQQQASAPNKEDTTPTPNQEGTPAPKVELKVEADPATYVPTDDDPAVVYNATGDTGLDLALQFIGDLGFGPKHPAVQAATTGDLTKLETILKGMGDRAKGYDRYMAVAKASFTQAAGKQAEANKASEAAVISAVGSEAVWTDVVQWAQKNADPSELPQINAALNGGALQAKAMATTLFNAYQASGAAKAKPSLKEGAGSGGVPTGSDALSPQQFRRAVADLTHKIGAAKVDGSPEYQALARRRQAYRD